MHLFSILSCRKPSTENIEPVNVDPVSDAHQPTAAVIHSLIFYNRPVLGDSCQSQRKSGRRSVMPRRGHQLNARPTGSATDRLRSQCGLLECSIPSFGFPITNTSKPKCVIMIGAMLTLHANGPFVHLGADGVCVTLH